MQLFVVSYNTAEVNCTVRCIALFYQLARQSRQDLGEIQKPHQVQSSEPATRGESRVNESASREGGTGDFDELLMPRKRSKSRLDHDERAPQAQGLKINQDFARKFEYEKRMQVLQRARSRGVDLEDSGNFRHKPAGPESEVGDDEIDDSDSNEDEDVDEDEHGVLLTKGMDRRIRETLLKIQSRDPDIYRKDMKYFPDEDGDNDAEGVRDDDSVEDDSSDEPVAGWGAIASAADREVKAFTLKDYVRSELETRGQLGDESEEEGVDYKRTSHGQNQRLIYDQEQALMKKAVLDGSKSVEAEVSDEDSNESDGDFFRKKERSDAEKRAEEDEFDTFLAKKEEEMGQQIGEDILMHSYLENETLDEKERFLRDYVLNNGWVGQKTEKAPVHALYEIEVDGGNDEEFLDKQDSFEERHNFRFEEGDEALKIQSYARIVPDSLRRDKRREARKKLRENRKRRKALEKMQKEEEIKVLKNVKRKEIRERLWLLKEASGGVDFDGFDLDADFDPAEFDRQMNQRFDEEYYDEVDENIAQEVDENLDAPHKITGQGGAVADEKLKELMDGYLQLGYEDIVGGEAVRFRYTNVDKEQFKITPEEILTMDDRELNRIMPLKHLAPYRNPESLPHHRHKQRRREFQCDNQRKAQKRDERRNPSISRERLDAYRA
uniref:Kri1-like C-terminal domain-containing protein n=1 Tax=Compsopogon caeruleus TaxID=31354 RepID=A0A7S1T8L4_9RHOD|mmetsp:Transcript_11383/g.23035  ORF Transcript_11383/g.23035 Transcript_11383/m.23035 type:complete len:665 (+) Transcript_11383:2332-4326(+)